MYLVSAQATRILQRIGWAYVCYHMTVFLVVLLFDASLKWSSVDFFGELIVGVFLYPTLLPALMLCGGVHGGDARAQGEGL